MHSRSKAPRRILVVAHAKDIANKNRFLVHIQTLVRENVATIWHEGLVEAGSVRDAAISTALATSDCLVILVTADLIASLLSKDMSNSELVRVIQDSTRQKIMILISHCEWQSLYSQGCLVLPESGDPISGKRTRDKAWTEVIRSIRVRLLDGHLSPFSSAKQSAPASSLRLPSAQIKYNKSVNASCNAFLLRLVLNDIPGSSDIVFGREDDIAWIDAAYENRNKVAIVALVAFGGVGKSTLVKNWLKTRFNDNSEVRFLGCSFYSQGTRDHAATSDQFIAQSLRLLGDTRLSAGSQWERGQRLAERLAERPTILILDGLEAMQYGPGVHELEGKLKDSGILALLGHLSMEPGESFCIITSRIPFSDPSLQVRRFVHKQIRILSVEAASELLQYRGVHGNEPEVQSAALYLGCHPLALVLAAEYLYTFMEGDIANLRRIPLIAGDTREGRHAKSVMAAYERSIRQDGDPLDLELLYILGFFDRPVPWRYIQEFRKSPALPGISEHLSLASESNIWDAVTRLRQWELISDVSVDASPILDAHPLVREYFGEQCKLLHHRSWVDGNARLYRFLAAVSRTVPESLDELEPLLLAIIYGCKAGLRAEVFQDVYLSRLVIGESFYTAYELGGQNLLLSALVHFFQNNDWGTPIEQEVSAGGLSTDHTITLLMHVGIYLAETKGFACPEARAAFSRARAMCAHNDKLLFQATRGLWMSYLVSAEGRFQGALNMALECSRLAQKLGTLDFLIEGEMTQGIVRFYMGQPQLAHEHLNVGLSLYNPDIHRFNSFLYTQDPGVNCLCYNALSLFVLGFPEQAAAQSIKAIQLADSASHAFSQILARYVDSLVSYYIRDIGAVLTKAAATQTLSRRHGFMFFYLLSEILLGWAHIAEGSFYWFDRMVAALGAYSKSGAGMARDVYLTLIAESCVTMKRIDDGLKYIDEAIKLLEHFGDRSREAEIYRIQALLILQTGPLKMCGDQVERSLRRSIDVAKRQGSLAFELRASLALARVLSDRGNRVGALQQLQPAYAKFSEGHRTRDLVDAHNLIMELSY